MRRLGSAFLFFAIAASARHDSAGCGTTRETPAETLFLHRQSVRARLARRAAQAATPAPNDRDIGNIAVIEDSGGVVAALNQFKLDNSTLTFTPTVSDASRYRYALSGAGYDSSAAARGAPVIALGDDDSRAITLPFPFPFFGATYSTLWINSDGNLTFVTAENASSARLTGRVTGGPPRIAPLFDDLDPSRLAGSVRTFADGAHFVVSWVAVPEWAQYGIGTAQTFQVTLYPDGRIAFAYAGATPSGAVVGIAPGSTKGVTALVSFKNDASAEYSAAVVERFGDTQEIDPVMVAQRFYQNHDDAYDYLVIYNNEGIGAMQGAIAYESTVRSSGSGWGGQPSDNGMQYGSASRLRSVLNMGNVGQYVGTSLNSSGFLWARGPANDTPITVLGHEAGHLFLALASIPDPNDPSARPMLGYGGVHWSFVFNSEASLDEGEQITDRGDSASPRFLTTAVTQHYSPLDQYLMGFRSAGDVPDTFLVTGYSSNVSPISHPAGGVAFGGNRLNVTVDDIIQAEGRRTPDSTVAQRRFRFAFILVTRAGTTVSSDDLQTVDGFRQQFPAYYSQAADGNASAEDTLNRSLKLSVFPAAGVVAGASATATLSVQAAPRADLTVRIDTPKGVAQAPATVVIPAGATAANFTLTGVKSGVEELLATPLDSAWETAFARLQVADASQVRLSVVNGAPGALTVRLSDGNDLPYPGARITAAASGGGTVTPAVAVTDGLGRATFQWNYGAAASAHLQLAVEAVPSAALTLQAGSAAPAIGAVTNAASFAPGISPGGIATIFGANLDPAAKVTVNGSPAQVFYSSTSQINFYVPPETPVGTVTVAALLPSGAAPSFDVQSVSEQAGIFTIVPYPDYLEIYATGLGPTRLSGGYAITTMTPQVFFGATPVTPMYSGLAPGYTGLYQLNVALPAGLSGGVGVVVAAGNSVSNTVQVTIP